MNAHLILIAEIFTLAGLISLFVLYFCSPARAQSTAFATAHRYASTGRYEQALSTLKNVETTYPRTPFAAEAAYQRAHIFRDSLRRPVDAMACYASIASTYAPIAFPDKNHAVAERLALAGKLDVANSKHPLYQIVALFNKLARGSYALAIFFLSLAVRILLAPLTWRQIKESKKMQALQPEMEKLQKAHSDDIATLSSSIRKLQQENGVHPYLGAVIGLAQAIVFIVMYNAVALYQYHVIGSTFLWIGTPFAAHNGTWLASTLCDPDMGLAALYALTMLVTQRLIQWASVDVLGKPVTPLASFMGPAMAFVMVYLWRSPSAFVLYWTISTAVGCIVECVARRRLTGTVSA